MDTLDACCCDLLAVPSLPNEYLVLAVSLDLVAVVELLLFVASGLALSELPDCLLG